MSIRKAIIKLLMKPKDGYAYIGTTGDDTPYRFLKQPTTRHYFLGMKIGDHTVFKPTLCTWMAIEEETVAPLEEVSFAEWIYGIQSDINRAYIEKSNEDAKKYEEQIERWKNAANGWRSVVEQK